MGQEDLVLKFGLVEARNPQAESVAQALAAFVDVLRAAAAVVEPEAALSVEVVGVEPGSQMFLLALKKAHEFFEHVGAGGDEFPLFKKALISLGGLVGGTVVIIGITNTLTPDPRIPADQMSVFQDIEKSMAESVELQRQSARFWGITQDEPAFDVVEVLRGHDRSVVYQVPRSEFAVRSGLWGDGAGDLTMITEPRSATWDVILVKPVLVPEQRRWTFARDGLEFSALMTDKAMLQAIHDRTLPLQIAEGVSMKVEIKYRERFDGNAWLPITGSHRVKRVITPRLEGPSLPLFSAPDAPQEDQ